MVVDELHLLFKVIEGLTRNLISTVMAHDAEKSPDISNELKRHMIKWLLRRIQECGVNFIVTWRLMEKLPWLAEIKKSYYQDFLKN